MFQKSKLLLVAGISVLLLILGFCGYKVHTLSQTQQKIRTDYASANNITFGLLSVSRWRDQLQGVISNEIQNFDLSPDQRKNLQVEIETILNSLIDKVVTSIEELHSQVPEYARAIIAQVENPASKKRLKSVAQSKMQQLGQDTYDSSRDQQLKVISTIYAKYHVADENGFNNKTDVLLNITEHASYMYVLGMFVCLLIILILWRFLRNSTDLYATLFMLSVIAAFIVLLVGLTTTMIEVDARIKSLNFYLLGTHITFNNQVLFFQSKSIVEVVRILIRTGRVDSIIVGVLLLCFSVLFPLGKLICASIYMLDKPWAKNKVVHFFAFKSGKWSMADVMVVGIMMTYIGFNGILESQLSALNIRNESLVSITTNNTSLQPGYIVFVGFVIFGLILSQILKNITGLKQE